MTTAEIWRDGERLFVAFDYSAQFVEALKAAMPRRALRYHPAERCWSFQPVWFERVRDLAASFFDEVRIDPALEPGARTTPASPYHELLSGLPLPVLKRIYRLIVREVHPDRAGASSTTLAQRINAAWAAIERDIGRGA